MKTHRFRSCRAGFATVVPLAVLILGCADKPAELTHLRFETSKGAFVVELHPEWAPLGVERMKTLVAQNYFNDARFFRVLPGFIAQFGMHADPRVNEQWRTMNIADDTVRQSNQRGMLTFATAGPNTRSNQLFINLVDNPNLDAMGFSPIGRVIEGMSVVDSLFGGYGEAPDQMQIGAEGNVYLQRQFPLLDYIKSVTVVPAPAPR